MTIIITPDQIGEDKKYGDEPYCGIEGIELEVDGWNNRRYALAWRPNGPMLSAIAVATGIFLHHIPGPTIQRLGNEDYVHVFDGRNVHIFYPDLETKIYRPDLRFRRATKAEWEEALLPLYYRDEQAGK